MVRMQDASWQFTRRQVLQTGAGLASLVALGMLPRAATGAGAEWTGAVVQSE